MGSRAGRDRSRPSAARRRRAGRRDCAGARTNVEAARRRRRGSSATLRPPAALRASRRFSSTVSRAKIRRPCGTIAMPARAISCAGAPASSRPSSLIGPRPRTDEADDRVHERRLADAVAPEQADDLALGSSRSMSWSTSPAVVAGADAADVEQRGSFQRTARSIRSPGSEVGLLYDGRVADLVRRPVRDQPARVEHRDPVARPKTTSMSCSTITIVSSAAGRRSAR